MDINLNCNQVCSLLNFYIEGNITPKLKEAIENHIENCPECRNKVVELTSLLGYREEKIEFNENDKSSINNDFMKNLSAYIDNELNPHENVKIKKMAISNPAARKKLDTMYKFQKLLHSAYNRTKNDIKVDYSKQVISQVHNIDTYTTTCFNKIALLFIGLICAIIAGFLYLYF